MHTGTGHAGKNVNNAHRGQKNFCSRAHMRRGHAYHTTEEKTLINNPLLQIRDILRGLFMNARKNAVPKSQSRDNWER